MSRVALLADGSYSKDGSTTLRQIKSVCTSVSERACVKSGHMVSFTIFLKKNFNARNILLHPFLGNMFNTIFLNGAGIMELFGKLFLFFYLIHRENKLLPAVYFDLNVLQYKIGSHPLGLIHKLVTGPLIEIF